MAKKSKPAKKAAKPAKKASKPAKKAAKPAAKKKVAKPVAKKKVAKPVAKKKAAKPVAKKKAAKPVAKKKAAKPVAKKKVTKPVAKKVTKPVAKKVVKPTKVVTKAPAKVVEKTKPVASKPAPIAVKPTPAAKPVKASKQDKSIDLDDDGRKDRDYEAPMVVEYKTPSIRKPLGPTPKPHVNTDTRTRYSDKELEEFRNLILKKLEEAQNDYELLKSTLTHKDDHGTDDTSPTFKLLEDGSDVLSKEETAALASRQEKFIQNLKNALIRIENKTYGICRATGKLISKERLRSVPHATLAIDAKLEQAKA